MDKSRDKVWAFLRKCRMHYGDIDMGRLCDSLLDEMYRGLHGCDSSLAMIPTVAIVLRVYLSDLGISVESPEALAILTNAMSMLRLAALTAGVAAATGIWLGFFPPRFYLNRLMGNLQPST